MDRHKGRFMRYAASISIAIVILTSIVYWQVGGHDFVSLDDGSYVFENPHVTTGLDKENLVWAFTSFHAGYWIPVTWISLMADAELHGIAPGGFHLTNLFFHIGSALILFFLLIRFTGAIWQSAVVAALFALHPMHVESVAWITERKDVLSVFFGFLALLFHAEYATQGGRRWYSLALLAFVLGLMAKPMLVTLPVVMLLMDFWPIRRFAPYGDTPGQDDSHPGTSALTSLVKEKAPFLACSFIFSAITIYTQHHEGATRGMDLLPLELRIANASTSYLKYLSKIFWPTDLAVFYPFPTSIPSWQVICSCLVLLVLSAIFIGTGKRHPFLVVGWFWFLVTLTPVIGLLQAGEQSMADRFIYLPATGLYIAVAWGVPVLTKILPQQKVVLALLAGTAIAGLAALTWKQLKHWQNSISLYQHTIQVTTDNYLAHHNLALAYAKKGLLDEAIEEYGKTIEINRNDYEAHNNYGLALAGKGQLDEAISAFGKAVAINPNHAVSYNNLGIALAQKGQFDEALAEYQKALTIDPGNYSALNNYGLALAEKGQLDQAIIQFKKALEIRKNGEEARKNLELATRLLETTAESP